MIKLCYILLNKMISRIKFKIAKEIAECGQTLGKNVLIENIAPIIKWNTTAEDNEFSFLADSDSFTDGKYYETLLKLTNTDNINYVKECFVHEKKYLHIFINKHAVIEDVLKEPSLTHSEMITSKKKTVVIDFSSPNIAKPFHFGHLRSTIIGNFIANVNEYMKNRVIKINYLGDWGTQFGLLKVGLNLSNNITDENVKKNPIKTLYDAYIYANKLSESNADIKQRALDEFHRMESTSDNDDTDDVRLWQLYRRYTVEEFTRIYNRLGVQFDAYEWESDYARSKITPVLEKIKQCEHVRNSDGRLVFDIRDEEVTFLKSDGSTLYLTRDVAAAISRYEKYKFDSMLYVVDNSQQKHFHNLSFILNKLNFEFASKIEHVRFGRILGMSTRKGEAIFLDDILDKVKSIMEQKQSHAITTRAEIGGEISDTLGISTIIINDLKRHRVANYEFDWETALKAEGNTGVKLQYAHCRLVSLEKNSGAILPDFCDPHVLCEPECIQLINQIARFEDVIKLSYDCLEASLLVYYAFKLCDATNKAFKVLQVKNQDSHISSQRLLLFHKSRQTLNLTLRILGLKPLDQM